MFAIAKSLRYALTASGPVAVYPAGRHDHQVYYRVGPGGTASLVPGFPALPGCSLSGLKAALDARC